jgi:hypothetical protein
VLIGFGALLALVAVPLPWYSVGGEVLPAVSGNGLRGAGILVFLAAVGLLAVLALPYAARSGRSAFDQPVVYVLLIGMGFVGLAISALESLNEERLGSPDRAPGLWLAAIGLVIAAWGLSELVGEGRRAS